MTVTQRTQGAPVTQDRPTGAGWSHGPSLRTRLTLSVALSVALVVGLVVMAGIRLAQQLLDADLRETARLTAIAVADDVELRPEADSEAIRPVLSDFITAAPSLRSISVFHSGGEGITPVASTSSSEPTPVGLVDRAIRADEPVWDVSEAPFATVAAPITRGDRITGAVVVSVSLTPVEQLRRGGRLLGAAGMVAAIIGITLLVHLLATRLIHGPLDDISRAVAQVTQGDLAARASVRRHDEIGFLASRLNGMLAELEDLHRSLNDRVDIATSELRHRNEQMVRSYQNVLQMRQMVGRAEQLAAVGQTMANVAHQIGTPLNLVSGHVQLLEHEVTDPVLQRRLRIVQEQVERVAATVRGLLERVRPDSNRAPVDVGALLERLAEAVKPQLAAAAIGLRLEIAPRLPSVAADETALELAVLNLITNAADAMPDGGVLSIRAEHRGAELRVEIQDTGTGIPIDLLPTIFDPWVTTKGRRGTGLGLSVTRDVIDRFGGTIAVASRVGEGSIFTIVLPAADPAPASGPAGSPAAGAFTA